MAASTPTASRSSENGLQSEKMEEKVADDILSPSDASKTEPLEVLPPHVTDETPTGEEEEKKWLTTLELVPIMVAICLACFLMLLDVSIIATAIPQITTHFHSLPDVGWYASAYTLASAALQPLSGKFYTHFKLKWTFMAFFTVFELGSLICGLATSSTMLIVGRAIAGMGSAGIQNGAFTIIAGAVPMERRPALTGIAMGLAQLGIVVGPLLGGTLTQYSSWRWCFYINLPIGGVAMVLLFFIRVPEQTPKSKAITIFRNFLKHFDLLGFAIFAAAAIQLLLALQYGGNEFAWNSSTVIGLFVGSVATFAVFLGWDIHKGDDAMIPISMLRKRHVWTSCLVFGFLMSQLLVGAYYLPIYFQAVKGASPTMSGVNLLPNILANLCFAVTSGALVGRLGYYLPWAFISGILLSIGNGIISTYSPKTSTGTWIGYQILWGAGAGCGMQIPIIAIQNNLPPSQISIAMSTMMFCQTFFGAVAISLGETIFSTSLRSLIPQYTGSNVSPEAVIAAGATGFREVVPAAELGGVLKAYAGSINRIFYLSVGMSVAILVFAWGMGWKDIRKKKKETKESSESKA